MITTAGEPARYTVLTMKADWAAKSSALTSQCINQNHKVEVSGELRNLLLEFSFGESDTVRLLI